MIVSDRYKYVFVEQPLTASTAIASELMAHYDGYSVLSKHSNYSDFLRIADNKQLDYVVVVGVRNPLDQIVSGYQKLLTNHLDAYDNPEMFEENGGWVSKRRREMFRYVHSNGHGFPDYFNKYFGRPRVKISQYTWCPSRYDFVIRFESLQDDFDRFLAMVGAIPIRSLPLVNKTAGKRDFLSYYTPQTHDDVRFSIGPIMSFWGYELPRHWARRDVPVSSKALFNAVNLAARFVVGRLALTPGHYQRLRSTAGRLTRGS